MSSARKNTRNLAINGSSFVTTGAVLFFLSPFVIHSLGAVEYGIWSLLNVLAGYMGIVDLGIRASTGRHVYLYIGRGDDRAVDETIRTGLGFFTVAGFLILAVGVLLGWGFPHAFSSVPADYRPLLMWLFPLMALSVWSSAIAAIFSSVLLAHERFDLARGVELGTLAIRTGSTILVLSLGYGIAALAIVGVVCSFLPLVCNAWLAARVYPKLRYWPVLYNRNRLRELGGYGLAAFISTTSVKVIGQTDLVIVGSLIDIAAVTVYSVGAMLVYFSKNLLMQIATTFGPTLQKSVARNEMGAARWSFFRQVQLASLLGIPVYVGFIMYGEPFIRLWMGGERFGESAVQTAATVMAILAAAKLLSLFVIGSGPLLAAMGHVRFNAMISVCQSLANLGISLVFVMYCGWGLVGVALGTFVSRLLVKTFILPWYACRKSGINWRNYLVQVGGRGLAATILFSAWCLVAQSAVPCASWGHFALSVLLALVGFVPVALLLLIPEADRSRMQSRLRLLWA